MKKKEWYTKLNFWESLFFAVGWISVSFIICISAAMHIVGSAIIIEQQGLLAWVFQMGLVLAVINIGFKGISHGFEDLEEASRRFQNE